MLPPFVGKKTLNMVKLSDCPRLDDPRYSAMIPALRLWMILADVFTLSTHMFYSLVI
jgi:hypothetical protein